MNELRKAAEMALEALDCLPWQASPIAREATQALRQALAHPKREWVGLTVDEKHQLNDALNLQGRFPIIETIEAKLKEKNT